MFLTGDLHGVLDLGKPSLAFLLVVLMAQTKFNLRRHRLEPGHRDGRGHAGPDQRGVRHHLL